MRFVRVARTVIWFYGRDVAATASAPHYRTENWVLADKLFSVERSHESKRYLVQVILTILRPLQAKKFAMLGDPRESMLIRFF